MMLFSEFLRLISVTTKFFTLLIHTFWPANTFLSSPFGLSTIWSIYIDRPADAGTTTEKREAVQSVFLFNLSGSWRRKASSQNSFKSWNECHLHKTLPNSYWINDCPVRMTICVDFSKFAAALPKWQTRSSQAVLFDSYAINVCTQT